MTEGCQKVIAASEKLTRVAEKLNNVGPDKFFRRYFPRNYGRVVSTWEAVEGKVNALWDGLGLGKGGCQSIVKDNPLNNLFNSSVFALVDLKQCVYEIEAPLF